MPQAILVFNERRAKSLMFGHLTVNSPEHTQYEY